MNKRALSISTDVSLVRKKKKKEKPVKKSWWNGLFGLRRISNIYVFS